MESAHLGDGLVAVEAVAQLGALPLLSSPDLAPLGEARADRVLVAAQLTGALEVDVEHDSKLSEATSPGLLAAVTVPTLILDSAGSTDDLTAMAATVARAMPNASHRSLAGEWHGVADDVLAPVLIEFFGR